ncbi:hypothetical protein [Methyloglobulus sp.]|uniref:hypothetical protein n=1 Tax=Methyloglobulus sp. TaxID=2518622 RepID=UPI003989BC10
MKRVYQHPMGRVGDFSKRYGIHAFIWYEAHEMTESAVLCEKQLKKWSRIAKIRLIEQQDPLWQAPWLDTFCHSCRNDGRGYAFQVIF